MSYSKMVVGIVTLALLAKEPITVANNGYIPIDVALTPNLIVAAAEILLGAILSVAPLPAARAIGNYVLLDGAWRMARELKGNDLLLNQKITSSLF